MTEFKREEIFDPRPDIALPDNTGISVMGEATSNDRPAFVQEGEFTEGAPIESYASEEQAITDINDLDLATEPMEAVDMDKLEETLAYAPSLKPGAYFDFIFKLDAEKPWKAVTIKGKQEAQFNYSALQVKEDGTPGKEIRFQQASTFRSPKMNASRVGELLFALGKLGEFNKSERKKQDILRLLSEASTEQVVFRGQVQWRHYDSTTDTTTHTAPAKPYKKDIKDKDGNVIGEKMVVEQPWPRDEKGQFARHPGNEMISRVMPTKETLEANKKAAA